jgi:N-methylhydantoinase A/oxoprolinase/acetone carboxylase beta subunit
MEIERYVDIRYIGQFHKLQVPLDTWPLSDATIFHLKDAFDEQHELRYGYAVSDEPTEIVAIGLSAIGLIPPVRLRDVPKGSRSAKAALKGTRDVYFRSLDGSSAVPIYDRYALQIGNHIPGPAIIEERDSTTVVEPQYALDVVQHGLLHIRRA